MNVAILYDAMENAEAGAGEILSGVHLFSHSLKQFYLHPCVDFLVTVWNGTDIGISAGQYIEQWKEEYGVKKPFSQFCCADSLQRVFFKLERQEREKIDLYIFHDIRYPCVTSDMIYIVAQKAAVYGVAVTVSSIDENIVLTSENKYADEKFRYVKYPIAIASAHGLKEKIDQKKDVLSFFSRERPYLCSTDGKNPVAFSDDSIELIKAIMYRKQGRK